MDVRGWLMVGVMVGILLGAVTVATVMHRTEPPAPVPVPAPPGPARQVTYVFEHEEQIVPRDIQAAMRSLAQAGVDVTAIDRDVRDAEGEVPDKYRAALAAVDSVPSLVVERDTGVIVLPNPTAQDVLELVP